MDNQDWDDAWDSWRWKIVIQRFVDRAKDRAKEKPPKMFWPILPQKKKCEHEWVETGLVKTWCKKCDSEGYYKMGEVVIINEKEPKDEMSWLKDWNS